MTSPTDLGTSTGSPVAIPAVDDAPAPFDRAGAAFEAIRTAHDEAAMAMSRLIGARELLGGLRVLSVEGPGTPGWLDGRDLAVAITDLEGVVLRLRHGSPR